MPTGDTTRAPGGEARRPGILASSWIDVMNKEGDVAVEVHVAAPLRAQRKPATTPSARRDASASVATDIGYAATDSFAFPTSTTAVLFSSFRLHWAHFVQAFQFSLTEPGMALVAAVILFAISFLGCITVFFIAPSLTTSLATRIEKSLDEVVSETEMSALPTSWMPHVVGMVQHGLQVLLIPSVLVGAAGMWVLGDPERRRPGKWLMGYGLLVLVHGCVLLYFLLRVFLSGQLGVWQNTSLQLFHDVLEKLDGEATQCLWEYAYPCSGFSSCCVTNTSSLNVSEEELMSDEEVWGSLCFVTTQSGRAVMRRRDRDNNDFLEDITKMVQDQCGKITAYIDLTEDYPLYSTACALANRSMRITPAHSTTCEDYIIGHFSSTIGFDMCLLFGMTVCSLVAGIVALITNHQRPRSSDFMPLNSPSSSTKESIMMLKGESSDDCRGANRKRS
ncbi:hypothetical protein conserved [Leishmania donovani]|uniref:Uncharacterized protein n=2 Tax=Leishmania donovani TaxID=5661 RepID=A0A504Y423_LEIDO|nr:hypothetical protein CGC20_11385 [Leishmania donovani]CAJ1991974.1 hypothetical protein conserved [Leishmania donovani]